MYNYAVYKYYIRSFAHDGVEGVHSTYAAYAHRLVLDNITMSKVLL